jgi:tetratricopeptide (TPR) repeat protein
MAQWQVSRLEEIDEIDDGRCPFRPVREHFGITTFGVNAWTGRAAGDRIINEHDESDEVDGDELYVVLQGQARFEIDGERVVADAGTLVSVLAGVNRTAFAEEADTTILAIGGGPQGQAYRPIGWETWSRLRRAFEAGRHEELVEQARELLADDPPYPMIYYNVACSESLIGHTDDALAHLRRAIEMYPDFARFAREDEDLAGLRETPEFAQITGG